MKSANSERRSRTPAFALVLSLFLIGLLAASGSGLALLTGTESIRSAWLARDLDHRLALESLLVCLPDLLKTRDASGGEQPGVPGLETFRVRIGRCDVICRVVPETSKMYAGDVSNGASAVSKLRSVAKAHGLPVEQVRPSIVADTPDTQGWPKLLWFDQALQADDPDDIFAWLVLGDSHETETDPVWSDHVRFWEAPTGQTWSLTVRTSIGKDRRRWYVVTTLADGRATPIVLSAL